MPHCRKIRRALAHTAAGPVHASLRTFTSPLPKEALPEAIAMLKEHAKKTRTSYAEPKAPHRRSKSRKKTSK